LEGDRKMGDGLKKRRWWKLHLLTWVLVLLVGGSLVVENFVNCVDKEETLLLVIQRGDREPGEQSEWCQFGWPFIYTEIDWGQFRSGSFSDIESYYIYVTLKVEPGRYLWNFSEFLNYSLPFLFTNILFALVILLATIFTTESYLRCKPKWQYSIQSIMVFTTFVALILANGKYNLVRWRGDELWEYVPFLFIWFGCWCVFWTLLKLVAVVWRIK